MNSLCFSVLAIRACQKKSTWWPQWGALSFAIFKVHCRQSFDHTFMLPSWLFYYILCGHSGGHLKQCALMTMCFLNFLFWDCDVFHQEKCFKVYILIQFLVTVWPNSRICNLSTTYKCSRDELPHFCISSIRSPWDWRIPSEFWYNGQECLYKKEKFSANYSPQITFLPMVTVL